MYDLKVLLTILKYFYIFIGVEKKNDDFRRYFHRKINRWDAAKNLLLVEKRQEGLRDCEREKRKYIKRKESFWLEGGKQEAAKKVVRISTTPQELPDTVTHTAPHDQQYSQEQLKKMTVTKLLALLSEQGKVFNKKTRKQDLINAYLATSTSTTNSILRSN